MLVDESMSGLSNTYPAPKGMWCYNDPENVLDWVWVWSISSGLESLVRCDILGMNIPGMIQMVS
jgi:hypothetical protein